MNKVNKLLNLIEDDQPASDTDKRIIDIKAKLLDIMKTAPSMLSAVSSPEYKNLQKELKSLTKNRN